MKIREANNGDMPYDALTYGDLINYINLTGLALCNDLKLANSLQHENKLLSKELGGFCDQFAITTEKISAPSNRVKKYKKRFKKYRKEIEPTPKYRKPKFNKFKGKKKLILLNLKNTNLTPISNVDKKDILLNIVRSKKK